MALPAGSYQPFEVAYLDAGNEIGRAQGYGAIVDAGTFAAREAAWAAFLSAMDAIVLGARKKDRYNDESLYTVAQPTNGAARELKLLVQCQNTVTGRPYHFTVPTIDPTIPDYVANVNAKDAVQLDSPTEIADFITATEDFVRDPLAPTNGCTVIGLKVVGRNN